MVRYINFLRRKILTLICRVRFKNKTLWVGAGARLYSSNIKFGKNVMIDAGVHIGGELNGKAVFGDNVKINRNTRIDVTGYLTVGNGTVISEEVIIYTHSHGKDPMSNPKPHKVSIGDNVWIGVRCIILSNVRSIPQGTIIPAGTVLRSQQDLEEKCLKSF